MAEYLRGVYGKEEIYMENYQQGQIGEHFSRPTEDQFTKTIEEYTGSLPSSAYLGVAVAAMGLSLLCQVTGQGKWGNFIAQWVPTWLIIGLYNKMVKLEGHDQTDRGSVSH
ncbi:MAG TPA: hypothetical protein VFP47_19435 [Pyrinomonadaceae bacterium]|nr:hypothetical protein [Pyrinomonadaceae bacterium]